MTEVQELKRTIRSFMQQHYTDERLCQLLAHAKDGKLRYYSCCCFIGIPTADHAVGSCQIHPGCVPHYQESKYLSGANEAETAFLKLAPNFNWNGADDIRRRILIPMIRAEMKRREWARKTEETSKLEVIFA